MFCEIFSFLFYIENPPKKSIRKVSHAIPARIPYNDIYEDETCRKNGECKADYEIPAERKNKQTIFIFLEFESFDFLDSIKNANPANWPGEMGEPYLPPDNLQEESKRRFAENMFDIAVSDRIALNRAMPDIRNDQ